MIYLVGGGGVHGLSQKNNQIVVSADYHILLTWKDTNQPNEAAELQSSNAMPCPPPFPSLFALFFLHCLFISREGLTRFMGRFSGCFFLMVCNNRTSCLLL